MGTSVAIYIVRSNSRSALLIMSHVQATDVLCRRHKNLSTSFVNFSPGIRKVVKDEKKHHGAVDELSVNN